MATFELPTGGGVIVGKNSDGTNKTVTLKEWQDMWFKMPSAKRQEYVNQFAKAGIKTDVVNGINAWIDYGKQSVTYSSYGGAYTPQQLMAQDVASKVGTSSATVAFTSKDAESLVKEAYVGLLGRDPNNKELATGMSQAMGQSSSTGTAGRQQTVIDSIKNSREYDTRMENKYLDAMYNAVASKVQQAGV